MSKVVREELTSGGETVEIFIEVEEEAPRWRTPGSYSPPMQGDLGPKEADESSLVTTAFSKGMRLIRTCAEQVSETVRQVSTAARPQEVEVKFGVKLTTEAGAFIAKTGTEAQMEVTLKWAQKKD